jgi:spore coat protein U-like protein
MKMCAAFCLLVMLLLDAHSAQGAISCNVSSPGISTTYSGTLSINQTSVNINCTRLSGDPATSAYSLTPDNGINATGQLNRAANSTWYLGYEEFQDSICSTPWAFPGGSMNGTIYFGTSLGVSVTRDYWVCIPADQVNAVGSYSDTVVMTLTYNDGTADVMTTGGHQIGILTTPSCSISTAPGTIDFSYTALQNTATTANTTFGTTCSVGTSYSISVDSDKGVISGLQYSLRINTISSGGSNPVGSSGTGVQQNFYINGTMPAEQAGACNTASCQDATVHTLLITY